MIKKFLAFIIDSTVAITMTVLVLCGGGFYLLGNTNEGLQVALQVAAVFAPGELHVGKAQGKLFSAFELQDITFRSAKAEVALDKAYLVWSPLELLKTRLVIHQLDLGKLAVKVYPDPDPAAHFDFKSLKILKRITASQLNIKQLTFTLAGKPALHFSDLKLAKIPGYTFFQTRTLEGEIEGTLTLSFKPLTSWALKITSLQINPGSQWPEWPGKINFVLNSQGNIGDAKHPATVLVELSKLNGQLRNYPLSGDINVTLFKNEWRIHQAHISNGSANIIFSGRVNDLWNLHWQANVPDLAALVPDTHGMINTQGTIMGPLKNPHITADFIAQKILLTEASIKQLNGKFDLNWQADAPFALTITGYDLNVHAHPLKKLDVSVSGNIQQNADDYAGKIAIAIAQQRYVDLQLSIPKNINGTNFRQVPLAAQMAINFPDLGMLQDYIPATTHLHGLLRGNLQFNGSLQHPRLTGQLNLTNGTVDIAKIGLSLQKLQLHATGDQSGHISYTGSVQAGTGMAQLQGTTDLAASDFPTELNLQGKNLQVVNLQEYKVTASPNLKFHITTAKISIDGNVDIPQAQITPKDFRQTITLPDDVVFVGENNKTPSFQGGAMPAMQIAVTFQNHILLHYHDLEATLGGNLILHAGPNHPATAVGALSTTSGTYKAYGQTLDIKLGRLTYTGGLLTNPGLNIKASRDINTVSTVSTSSLSSTQTYGGTEVLTVGVRILGTIDKPQVSLFSSPTTLAQDDILSYLVLGMPRTQASKNDSLAILSAANAMNLGGSGTAQLASLTNKLKTGLGLTELNVENVQSFNPNANGVEGNTSLVVGKKLTKNLYVHYSVSLFSTTPVSILNLRYLLNKHWSVQTETSTLDNGVDLLYSIERD
jgi:autotransporter translocation and assembly factor TamB